MTNRVSKVASLALAALVGCKESPPGDPPASPSSAVAPSTQAGAPGESWELVQLEHEDPPNQNIAMIRDVAYDGCVGVAKLLKLPVKPFPPVPADHGNRRVTRITNGVSTVVKEEFTGNDDEVPMDPKTGCQFSLGTDRHVSVRIVHDGKATEILDGKVTDVEEVPPWPAHAPRGKPTTEYTQARTVNGVALRCLPPNFWTLNTNKYLDLRELCVYATDKVMVDESGDPVILLSHTLVNVLNPKYAHKAIVEPLSMRRITKNEKDPYQVASWTQ